MSATAQRRRARGGLVRGGLAAGALALAVGCCGSCGAQTTQPAVSWTEPRTVCEIRDARLTEASGLAASRRSPAYYYTHNDSAGKPHVYVLDRSGRIYATIRLRGARNVDWEDIALAPGEGPDAWDVCVADIGDNKARRPEIIVYRFREPNSAGSAGRTIDIGPEVYRCRYEDGPRDAEGFAVHPQTGEGYVFSKQLDGKCCVYRLATPWTAAGVNRLARVGELVFPTAAAPLATMVTAADISPDGRRLVTRSYVGGWEWRLAERAGTGDFARLFCQTPRALHLAAEPQGEALCFAADGTALLTVSEQTPTTLYESRLAERHGAGQP